MRTLLIEPFGGLAGDMLLAALLDLRDERFTLDDLRALAAELVPGECTLELARTRRGGIEANHLDVRTEETEATPHRHYDELEELVQGCASLSPASRARALATLWRIAEAEGRVHGCDPVLFGHIINMIPKCVPLRNIFHSYTFFLDQLMLSLPVLLWARSRDKPADSKTIPRLRL